MSRYLLIVWLFGGVLAAADSQFDQTVKPVLASSCTVCHNDQVTSGGLNITSYLNAQSLADGREEWEKIVRKIRAGEMPPKGMPRPPLAKTDAAQTD